MFATEPIELKKSSSSTNDLTGNSKYRIQKHIKIKENYIFGQKKTQFQNTVFLGKSQFFRGKRQFEFFFNGEKHSSLQKYKIPQIQELKPLVIGSPSQIAYCS